MIYLGDVTLVCIDCLYYEKSIQAINKSIENIQFREVLFFSDKIFHSKDFHTIEIEKINSKQQYSEFVFKKLVNYINSDFVLIIQWDGFIINPNKWNNEFLKYDYIGAAWWYKDNFNVGNGGFSLRSKKLLKVLQKQEFNDLHPEDDKICRKYRSQLEKLNIKFAPEMIATKFSFERNGKYNNFKADTFGFHGEKELKEII